MSGLLFGSVTSLFFGPLFYDWLDDMTVWRPRVNLNSRGGATHTEWGPPPSFSSGEPVRLI
jgi:hypothetical protein